MAKHIIQYNISIVKRVVGGAEVEPFVADHIIPHDIKRFEDYCNADMMVTSVQIDTQRFFLDDEPNEIDEIDEPERECEACKIDLDELREEQHEHDISITR